jgi:uncharacterized OB-fold protein
MQLHLPPNEMVQLEPDRWTEPFWTAASEHRLVCARCSTCGTWRLPPSPFCGSCRSHELEWHEVDGHGPLYTFTVIHHAVLPSLRDHVPYAVGLVSLPDAGGVRLHGNLVDVDSDDLRVDLPMELVWDDIREGVTVPRWRPAPS